MDKTNKEKINKQIENATELSYDCTGYYDELYIVPEYTNSAKLGYRDLGIYGIKTNNNRHETGIFIEKLNRNDHIRIDSFFKKLKGFQLSIDMPYLTNIIRIYCRDHLIRVKNSEFDFVKRDN